MVRSAFRRGASIAASAAFIAALLTGCTGTSEPDSTEQPEPTTTTIEGEGTPSPTASPTPTPSTEPVASPGPEESQDPSDPSTWLIDFEGFGPVVLGEPVDTTALAESYSLTIEESCPRVRFFDSDEVPGVFMNLSEDLRTVQIASVAGWAVGTGELPATFSAASPETAEGIGIGSTVDELLAAYPDAVVRPHQAGEAATIDGGTGTFIHFFFFPEKGIVQAIEVSPLEQMVPEYCG